MRARIGDIVAGSGAVLMAVALAGMARDLGAGLAPATPVIIMLSLGLLGMVAALVWRFEQTATQQLSCAQSLQEARARRAELLRGEQTSNGVPQALIAV